ncbi:putative histidine phosphatase superfamily, clade-2, histidine acid phosphatase active [Septoria linicola]|nr:putative histidine phosphatase superfamily, clade-2, histidine acid phosphatase active [Septoria linicola]
MRRENERDLATARPQDWLLNRDDDDFDAEDSRGEQAQHGYEMRSQRLNTTKTPVLFTAATSRATTDSEGRRFITRQKALFAAQVLLFGFVLLQFVIMYRKYAIACAGVAGAVFGTADAAVASSVSSSSSSNVPDYFVTKPELVPGPTPTGSAGFLAETNPAPFSGTTYYPNSPLETQVPIVGNKDNGNIFQMHGQLSHYFPNPEGFGVDEYHLPKNASIVQLNMLSRHGSRYPTTGAGATVIGQKLLNYTTGVLGKAKFSGPLEFLNTWTYKLGAEILVPVGKQELFDSGTLHQIEYGHLYKNNGTKITARSTTQDRMLKSAEYFLAGFFGLDWTQNATLVLAIENTTGIWNNTLAGYYNCNNSNAAVSTGGNNASTQWYNIYLANATHRLNSHSEGFNWTVQDAYNAQSLCAYETVALGYSAFCGLFTYAEWEGYEYSIDLSFAGNNMFQSPTGRAVGIGYVEEILARLQGHLITKPTAQINVTLDSNPVTFPLNQTLNFDFSHDTNIASILTAFGLTQFAPVLPADRLESNRSLKVSHMEPFGARLDMEIIETPKPLSGHRKNGTTYEEGGVTRYIHFILNQRTIPLGKSLSKCGQRDDGWCELTTFLEVQSKMLEEAEYEFSCFGKYPVVPYGGITNGVPVANATRA